MAAIVAVQVAVPGVALLQDAPTRLGFQMYSGVGGLPEVTADGRAVPVEGLIAAPRAEIAWARHMPEQACRQLPRAARVTVTTYEGVRRELPCRP